MPNTISFSANRATHRWYHTYRGFAHQYPLAKSAMAVQFHIVQAQRLHGDSGQAQASGQARTAIDLDDQYSTDLVTRNSLLELEPGAVLTVVIYKACNKENLCPRNMSDFPPLPAEWVHDTSRDPPVYTRPLVGSELVMHRQWKAFDGCGEVCLGVSFTTTVNVEALKCRARDALDKLRFLCPLIACTIEEVASEDGVAPQWVYTTSTDRKAWLNLAFAVEDQGVSLNPPQFINSVNLKTLPYTDEHGTISIFRVYLLTTSKRRNDGKLECGLYLHGSHSILDGGAALNALTLMCEWMSGKGMEVSVSPWEEWRNLPVDPITATGGPLEEWEASGVDLVQDVVEQVSRTSTCHLLSPPSRPLNSFDLPLYYGTILSEAESAAIVAQTKKLGVSLTALFHAAHCLAQFNMNPVSAASTDTDFSSGFTVVNLERYAKPPVNPKTHLVSFHSVTPTRFSMSGPLMEPSEKKRLLMTAKTLQECMDRYLTHPCLPQLLSVLGGAPQAEEQQAAGSPWCCAFTNMGVMEKALKTEYGEITVERFYGANRPGGYMTTHMWSLHGKLYFQVHGASAWGEDVMKTLLEETIRIGCLVLDGSKLDSLGSQSKPKRVAKL